jgi:hypothetical protein
MRSEVNVKRLFQQSFVSMGIGILLMGCATTPAPDFGGRWKPVNRFAVAPTEIPLYSSYVYQATPMDGTLKAMLERWAKDAGMTLDYRLSSDYTLYGAVSRIGTTNPQEAMTDVTAAYATQGVSVSIVGNSIVVQVASSAVAPVASAVSTLLHSGG